MLTLHNTFAKHYEVEDINTDHFKLQLKTTGLLNMHLAVIEIMGQFLK